MCCVCLYASTVCSIEMTVMRVRGKKEEKDKKICRNGKKARMLIFFLSAPFSYYGEEET